MIKIYNNKSKKELLSLGLGYSWKLNFGYKWNSEQSFLLNCACETALKKVAKDDGTFGIKINPKSIEIYYNHSNDNDNYNAKTALEKVCSAIKIQWRADGYFKTDYLVIK